MSQFLTFVPQIKSIVKYSAIEDDSESYVLANSHSSLILTLTCTSHETKQNK